MRFVLPLICSTIASGILQAQTQPPKPLVATVITKAELDAPLSKTPLPVVLDRQVGFVNVEGAYNVAVATVGRRKGTGSQISGSLSHSQVTEIYTIVSGSGTLVSGGSMENEKPAAADSSVVRLTGPTSSGGVIRNGESRRIGPGDVLVIPPKVPHWFSEITSDLVYVIVRVDPHKVLPMPAAK